MDRPAERIVFGPFTLDLRAGRLLRGDQPIPLRPKTWAVLRFLAERPGALVAAREIFEAVWPDATVTDDTLAKSIGEIRKALGDDVRAPSFVERVHGRGFRFIGTHASTAGRPGAFVPEPNEVREALVERLVVGRRAELQKLERCLERAHRGQRQLVFVAGEAGIGKTALIEEFLARVATSPGAASTVVGQGSSIEQRGPCEAYMPLLAALEQLARGPRLARVVSLLRRFAPTWLVQLPWLLDETPGGNRMDGAAEGRAERMLREFCAFAEALSQDHTVVLVLEDLHWSDPASLELLVLLAQRREPARILIVASCRPLDVDGVAPPLVSAMQTLRQRRRCVEIQLPPLTPTDVAGFLAQRLPGSQLRDEVARLIHDRTGGSPLFMVALLDDLLGRGWLVETSPGWALAVPLAKASLHVPDDLRQLISTQLAMLPKADQALLAAASVVGTEFAVPPVAAACGLQADDAEATCERLSRSHRFLRASGTSEPVADGGWRRYRFVHALYQQVVYEEIPQGKRQRFHLAIGEALESGSDPNVAALAPDLAFHFERSRDAVRGIRYLAIAARAMQGRFAPREAIAYIERGFALLPALREPSARLHLEIELRSVLSWALSTLNGYASEPARRNFEQVMELCERSGSQTALYQALYALWHSQAARAEVSLPNTAARMAQISESLDDPELRAQAVVVLGRTLFWQGRLHEALVALQSVVEFWNHEPGAVEGPAVLEPPGIAVYFYCGAVSGFLGRSDRGRSYLRQALAVAHPIDDPFTQAGSALHAAYLEHLWGDVEAVALQAQRALDLADEHDFPFWRGMAKALVGWAWVQRGERERGARDIRDGIAIERAGNVRSTCSHFCAFLAQACLSSADRDGGLAAVAEGLALVAEGCDRVYEPELWRLKGELLIGRVAPRKHRSVEAIAHAESCFHRSLSTAESMGARLFEMRTAVSLARLWITQQRQGAARDLLTRVYGQFTEGFDLPDVRAARALLAELPTA